MTEVQKKILLAMAISSLVINNYSIIVSNLDKVKKAKKNLKYRKDLCMESKEGLKVLNQEVLKNVLVTNAIIIGAEVIPIVNVLSSIYLFNRKENMACDIEVVANYVCDEINKIEDNAREKNANAYREIVADYNLEPLVDISLDDLKLSYKELKKLLKKHNLVIKDTECLNDDGTAVSYVYKKGHFE